MKILDIFGEHRLEFVYKWKIINSWRMISIGQGMERNLHAKFWAFGPKMNKILIIFKIFCLKSGKSTFSQFLPKYFLEFCLLFEIIYPWKIAPDFYNKFSDGGGGLSGIPSPPPSGRYWLGICENNFQMIRFLIMCWAGEEAAFEENFSKVRWN